MTLSLKVIQDQNSLKSYDSPDDVDLWVGGLAEQKDSDSMLGETMSKINADQFQRLRDGDRFWYENTFSGKELSELKNLKLSDVIKRNTDITNIQDNAMISTDKTANKQSSGANGTRGATGQSAANDSDRQLQKVELDQIIDNMRAIITQSSALSKANSASLSIAILQGRLG